MALHTETYLNILKRWCAYTGIEYSDLLTNQAELFKQFAQQRLREIWFDCDWSDTIAVQSAALTSQAFTVDTTYAYILGIYEANPLTEADTAFSTYRFRRAQDVVYVYGDDVPATVYVLYKKRAPEFDSDADTVPYRFAEYIAVGAYADWLRTEQDEMAERIEGRATKLLLDERDIWERQEGNWQWDKGYQVYQPVVY